MSQGATILKIHEYQAKDILAKYGIPVQPGKVAHTPEEAEAIARELGEPVVIKAQVYVGGRGKAGGIQFGDTPEQAREAATRVLGMDIKGLTVEKVLVTSKIDIKDRRWYRHRRSCRENTRKNHSATNRYALGTATL
jgi:succinyl-CoA synthetase beta subunit